MPENYYGVVEMGFVFGLIVVFCLWQLYSIEKTRQRLRRAPPSEQSRAQNDGSAPD
jgi:hypothetical protein